MCAKKSDEGKSVGTITHLDERRTNIPTAEHQAHVAPEVAAPVRVAMRKRDPDLDPQLVWRGKYDGDDELSVMAPPLYIQEKIHPRAIIDDLMRGSREARDAAAPSLFADFNGMPKGVEKTDFYRHDQNWTNRMILGDSLQVMASLAEREGLRGRVQCVYIDPPYGIRFNSNFQWSTTSRDVRDGRDMTREPEQVKAFRDTWRDGIHSYLGYLRDRLLLVRELLADSGSVFVQIGDENVHRVRLIMDEVFGNDNFVSIIWFRKKTMPLGSNLIEQMGDWIIHFAKNKNFMTFNKIYTNATVEKDNHWNIAVFNSGNTRKMTKDEIDDHSIIKEDFDSAQLISMSPIGYSENRIFNVVLYNKTFSLPKGKSWKTDEYGMERLKKSSRLVCYENGDRLRYLLKHSDYPITPISSNWNDTSAPSDMHYVVETSIKPIQRCILMTTNPGDLVLDPTCGSGTTAYVAEQWGRRWITIDTSRVALALARARLMGARYPWYILADSRDGQLKEAELRHTAPSTAPTGNSVRLGFVCERVPHVTLKSIANNAEIDVIYDSWQERLEPLRARLNEVLGTSWEEWEIPRDAGAGWPPEAVKAHGAWWKGRIARQKEIDASIAARADFECLHDRPYEDRKKVRVAGPFTVESLSPHRMLGLDENGELIDPLAGKDGGREGGASFEDMILENLATAGIQQADRDGRIPLDGLKRWPGEFICAEARCELNGEERRAAIFIGPEFGTVTRNDLIDAAHEAGDAKFDLMVACAFNYDASAADFARVGALTVLKARMNADLHMGGDLKRTGGGNLFVVFGEPDIEILEEPDGRLRVKILGVDVFDPAADAFRTSEPDKIACWFVDTDYNSESFFVRQAYFLGANNPYEALRKTLKAEIDADAWEALHSDVSRPFPRPESGRIAVKVINHLGDEVMKVFRV